jgi:LemA protein
MEDERLFVCWNQTPKIGESTAAVWVHLKVAPSASYIISFNQLFSAEGHFAILQTGDKGSTSLLSIGSLYCLVKRGSVMTISFVRVRSVSTAVLLALAVAGCGYNSIPTYEEQAKAKWADVQNNYQRRADLIPNLVATVQGYATQEKDVLTAVVEARAKATQVKIDVSQLTDPEKLQQFQAAQNQLSGALGRLLAVSENYPDLKSNQNFLALQSQLEGTENRIAVARHDYIEAVRVYNTTLKTFPGLLWAATLFRSNKPMAEFAANDNAQTPPQVKF